MCRGVDEGDFCVEVLMNVTWAKDDQGVWEEVLMRFLLSVETQKKANIEKHTRS
jgi:hypothetical protein